MIKLKNFVKKNYTLLYLVSPHFCFLFFLKKYSILNKIVNILD